jgi:5-methylcytosine-specific restriction protein A
VDEPEIAEAEEGALLTRVHRARERSRKLVQAKKKSMMEANGQLSCEACGFDFAEAYGALGEGFIECHHRRPLHSLRPNQRTSLSDLALVCANCHRMIHRKKHWLTVEEVAELLAS